MRQILMNCFDYFWIPTIYPYLALNNTKKNTSYTHSLSFSPEVELLGQEENILLEFFFVLVSSRKIWPSTSSLVAYEEILSSPPTLGNITIQFLNTFSCKAQHLWKEVNLPLFIPRASSPSDTEGKGNAGWGGATGTTGRQGRYGRSNV